MIGVEENDESQARFRATMSGLLAKDTENLLSTLKHYRSGKQASQLIDQAGTGSVFTGKEALSQGLVDELGSYHKILKRDFPDSKLHLIRTPTNSMAFHRAIKLSNYFGVRLVLYVLIGYKVLSYVFKLAFLGMLVPKDASKKAAAK